MLGVTALDVKPRISPYCNKTWDIKKIELSINDLMPRLIGCSKSSKLGVAIKSSHSNQEVYYTS